MSKHQTEKVYIRNDDVIDFGDGSFFIGRECVRDVGPLPGLPIHSSIEKSITSTTATTKLRPSTSSPLSLRTLFRRLAPRSRDS